MRCRNARPATTCLLWTPRHPSNFGRQCAIPSIMFSHYEKNRYWGPRATLAKLARVQVLYGREARTRMEEYVERVVDLTEPDANQIYNLSVEDARELIQ